jgi:hypothetical protein
MHTNQPTDEAHAGAVVSTSYAGSKEIGGATERPAENGV